MKTRALLLAACAAVLAGCGQQSITTPEPMIGGARFEGGMMYGGGLDDGGGMGTSEEEDACPDGERGGMMYGGGLAVPCPEPQPEP